MGNQFGWPALGPAILAAACLGGGLGAAPPEREAGAAGELASLNEASRAAYKKAREEALARSGPVILVSGDNLVLRYGISRTQARVIPAVYHDLKAISHIPLALYALLAYRKE